MKIGHIYPIQCWPVMSGADSRHLQVDKLLKKLGHQVINLSTYKKRRMWNKRSLAHFRDEMGDIHIFNTHIELKNIIKNCEIDTLFISYLDTAIEFDIHNLDIRKILEVSDIGIHNFNYEKALKVRIKEGKYDDLSEIPLDTPPVEEYKKYDGILTIAKHESLLLHELGIDNTYIPYTPPIRPIKNTYEDYPLSIGGQSVVNMHGLYWLDKVLGVKLFSRIPDMRIEVAGIINEWVQLSDRFKTLGFVENLDTVFKHARFGICPSIYGSGQKIKILEMMGASLPVIAYKTMSAESPLTDESGLVSDDPKEWMEMCTELWLNRTKCRQMGEIAKKQVESWFPEDKQLERLSKLL